MQNLQTQTSPHLGLPTVPPPPEHVTMQCGCSVEVSYDAVAVRVVIHFGGEYFPFYRALRQRDGVENALSWGRHFAAQVRELSELVSPVALANWLFDQKFTIRE